MKPFRSATAEQKQMGTIFIVRRQKLSSLTDNSKVFGVPVLQQSLLRSSVLGQIVHPIFVENFQESEIENKP